MVMDYQRKLDISIDVFLAKQNDEILVSCYSEYNILSVASTNTIIEINK